jgi:hypothetical protein
MPKNSGKKELVKGQSGLPVPVATSFSKQTPATPEQPQVRLPEGTPVRGSDVVKSLSFRGKGWDNESETLLAVPDTLYRFEGEGTFTYSSDRQSGIGGLIRALRNGSQYIRPKADYGITLYETASTTYFVLFDASRKILVRAILHCYHDKPPEKNWSDIKQAIKTAVALSQSDEGKKKDSLAVHDGFARIEKIADS